MFQLRAAETGLEFHIEKAPGIPETVVADQAKLRKILINLLGNAFKFTVSGGVEWKIGRDGDLLGSRCATRASVFQPTSSNWCFNPSKGRKSANRRPREPAWVWPSAATPPG